jgi:pimeloyl-ACP methyl ester carboxylesterase
MQESSETLLGRIATELLAAQSLLNVLPEDPRLALFTSPASAGELRELQRLMEGFGRRLGLRRIKVANLEDLNSVELVLSRRIVDLIGDELDQFLRQVTLPKSASIMADVIAAMPVKTQIRSKDGSRIWTYSYGNPRGCTVVFALPCGVPVGIISRWLMALGRDCRLLTWETRGMFLLEGGFEHRGADVAAQAEDLEALLDHHDVTSANIIGFCGGAVIALLAGIRDERIASLCLFHGDFELGSEAPKTVHQRGIQEILAYSRESRENAAEMYESYTDPGYVLRLKMRRDLAHHLLYPYSSAEVFYRYACLNGAIMATDCRQLLRDLHKPVLVVTSNGDDVAHPEGSRFVSRTVPGAQLYERPLASHLSIFDAPPDVAEIARAFIGAHQ